MKETSTMIKRVIPYLTRRGYEIDNNMFFEEAIKCDDKTLFQDIVIKKASASKKPLFVIEVKRDTLKLQQSHINQALKYGKHSGVPFIVVTNGIEFRMYNVNTKNRITFNTLNISKVPSYKDMDVVLKMFKNNPELDDIILSDKSLPFRPTVSASQLEELLKRCHNIIRNVEKDETHIFGDLSKIIFLKLLEEKADAGDLPDNMPTPLTRSFYELADPAVKDDEVMEAIRTAVTNIFTHPKFKDLAPIATVDAEFTGHEGVSYKSLLYIKNKSTYKKLVKEMAKIHFMDADLDVKGSVFEYFIRSTLQGPKGLGQYFTPRPIIQFMCEMVDIKKYIKNMQITGTTPKIMDPACGSGGFLIYGLSTFLRYIDEEYKSFLSAKQYKDMIKKVKENVFFGQDANPSIVIAAKMNMIIAGDGSSNIYQGNSLSLDNIDKLSSPNLIITNPPFGSSESDSLDKNQMEYYETKTTTAQGLFIQYMINQVEPDGEIATIIDESILNASKWKSVREYIMKHCYIEAIVSLPKATFTPNKINVKTSILYLKKKNATCPEDYIQEQPIRMIELHEIGYDKKGDIVSTSIDVVSKVVRNRWNEMLSSEITLEDTGGYFEGYPLTIAEIHSSYNPNLRIDYKYHNPDTLKFINDLINSGGKLLLETCNPTNPIEYKKLLDDGESPSLFKRGKTPSKQNYNVFGANVRMIKAGNIGKIGPQEGAGIDFVISDLADDYESSKAKLGDILLASTGEGTLGKSMAVEGDLIGGLVDGHVTIIRLKDEVNLIPEFVVWFMRSQLGQKQIERLYTGSTGQIELTERDVENIVIPIPSKKQQEAYVLRCQNLVAQAQEYKRNEEKALTALKVYSDV